MPQNSFSLSFLEIFFLSTKQKKLNFLAQQFFFLSIFCVCKKCTNIDWTMTMEKIKLGWSILLAFILLLKRKYKKNYIEERIIENEMNGQFILYGNVFIAHSLCPFSLFSISFAVICTLSNKDLWYQRAKGKKIFSLSLSLLNVGDHKSFVVSTSIVIKFIFFFCFKVVVKIFGFFKWMFI